MGADLAEHRRWVPVAHEQHARLRLALSEDSEEAPQVLRQPAEIIDAAIVLAVPDGDVLDVSRDRLPRLSLLLGESRPARGQVVRLTLDPGIHRENAEVVALHRRSGSGCPGVR